MNIIYSLNLIGIIFGLGLGLVNTTATEAYSTVTDTGKKGLGLSCQKEMNALQDCLKTIVKSGQCPIESETETETETDETETETDETEKKFGTFDFDWEDEGDGDGDGEDSGTKDDYQEQCLQEINRIRSKMGKRPLKSGNSEQLDCAQRCAETNSAANRPHSLLCPGAGQVECPRFQTISQGGMKQCVDAYFQEGPPRGGGYNHYSLVSGARQYVACGYVEKNGRGWYTQNLY